MIDRATVETCGVEKSIYINEEIFINKIIIKKYYLNRTKLPFAHFGQINQAFALISKLNREMPLF